MRPFPPARRALGITFSLVLVGGFAAALFPARAEETAQKPAPPASTAKPKKKAPPGPTLQELLRLLEQQRALIENQQ